MSVPDDEEPPEADLRKRAAWLLVMLAVVAGAFVLISVTLFNTSGGGGTPHGQVADLPTDVASSVAPSTSRPAGSSTPVSPASHSSSAAASTPVPTPSCPGDESCSVQGDVGATMSAINAYRAQHGKKAVPTTSTAQARRCALTNGGDCPSSFVWVRVDDLSGAGVVKGVTGFNSADDLLEDSARSFEVGWAYNPGNKSLSCALIRND